jgi:hypothetical protein
MYPVNRLISAATTIAVVTFIGGTLILFLYFLTSAFGVSFLGLAFGTVAMLVNAGVVVWIVIRAIRDKQNRTPLLTSVGYMMLNLPVGALYIWLAFMLSNTMRITFVNEHHVEIKNITVVGCEEKKIKRMRPGQEILTWIKIPNDCEISVSYDLDGTRRTELVYVYVTRNNGQILTYEIGAGRGPFDPVPH